MSLGGRLYEAAMRESRKRAAKRATSAAQERLCWQVQRPGPSALSSPGNTSEIQGRFPCFFFPPLCKVTYRRFELLRLEILPEFSAGDSLSLLFFRNLLKSLSSFLDKNFYFFGVFFIESVTSDMVWLKVCKRCPLNYHNFIEWSKRIGHSTRN